jgi:hypothetical protein
MTPRCSKADNAPTTENVEICHHRTEPELEGAARRDS